MSCVLNSAPDVFDVFEPAVGGSLVADATPDAFLRVQAGLVTGQVSQAEPSMGLKKQFNLFAFVPAGSIDIQPDGIAMETTIERCEASEKALPIACGRRRQSCPSEQWSNPAEKVQSFVMVACRWHFQSRSFLGPTEAQPRVKAESCLVFEDNRLMGPQIVEFFLTQAEISGPRPNWLADKNSQPVSVGIPVDASIVAPASQSALCQTFDSNAVPMSAHPTGLDSSQPPMESSPNRPPLVHESDPLIAPDAQVVPWASKSRARARLPDESTHSGFDGLYPAPHRSTPVAVPPQTVTVPQSSRPHGRHESPAPSMPILLGTLSDESTPRFVFSCPDHTAASTYMSTYLCRLY